MCQVGLEIARFTGNREVFDHAIAELKSAEEFTGDKDISRRISRLEARLNQITIDGDVGFGAPELDDD